jgi:hypothetical protein
VQTRTPGSLLTSVFSLQAQAARSQDPANKKNKKNIISIIIIIVVVVVNNFFKKIITIKTLARQAQCYY